MYSFLNYFFKLKCGSRVTSCLFSFFICSEKCSNAKTLVWKIIKGFFLCSLYTSEFCQRPFRTKRIMCTEYNFQLAKYKRRVKRSNQWKLSFLHGTISGIQLNKHFYHKYKIQSFSTVTDMESSLLHCTIVGWFLKISVPEYYYLPHPPCHGQHFDS